MPRIDVLFKFISREEMEASAAPEFNRVVADEILKVILRLSNLLETIRQLFNLEILF